MAKSLGYSWHLQAPYNKTAEPVAMNFQTLALLAEQYQELQNAAIKFGL